METIESIKSRNVSDDDINRTLRIIYSEPDLVNAFSLASSNKCMYDHNSAYIKNEIDLFCVGENAQYKGMIEGFMNSKTTKDMEKDVVFLKFALSLMNSRLSVASDDITAYNAKACDVLKRLTPQP
jgi:hypothetical protein